MLKRVHRLLNVLVVGILLGTAACQKTITIEDNPSERARAISVAEKFLMAFDNGKIEQMFEISSAPFWGDGDVILNRQSLLEKFTAQIGEQPSSNVSIKGAQFLTLEQIRVINPRIHRRLKKSDFLAYYPHLYLVVLLVEIDGRENNGLILLNEKQGMWEVVGIGD